jgi:DNA-binding NarL/FixJ family response regulator
MSRIRSLVEAVRGGAAGVLQLAGDPGIGKSRLLAETGQVAAQAGLAVITGSASQFEREVPFAVFSRLFDWAHVVPGADADGSQPDVERFRFYREVRDRVAARAGGVALLIDDLHWADRGSLELLQHLIRHPPSTPLLIAAAYRPRQLSARAAEVFIGANPERLDLEPLGVSEIGTLAGIGAAEAKGLHAASGGNPFYALALTGTPYPTEPIHPTATDRIPPAVSAAVHAELAAVPDDDLAVLRAAAVAGDPFDPALVAALVERPFAVVLDTLDRLAERDLVRAEPSEPGRLRLRHPLLRSIVYHDIRPGQRLTLHARAAAALAERGEHVVTRAPHLARAAQPGDTAAANALVGAARQIMPTAPDTAARWLRRALALIPEGAAPADPDNPSDPAEDRWRLMLLLADAEVSSGRVDSGRAALQELLDLLPPTATELRLEAVMRSAFADRLLGRYVQATALLAGALAQAGEDDATVLLAVEAVTCSLLRCSTDSTAYAERAIAAAAIVGKPELAAAASIVAAMNGAFHGDSEDALARLTAAAPILDGAHDEALFRLMDPLEQLAWTELLLERTAEAIGHFDRGLDISRRHGQVHITPYLLIGRCLALSRRGLVDAALDCAVDADEAARLIGSDTMQAMALAMRATALLWRDGPDAALVVAEGAVRRNDRTRYDWWASVARRVLARAQIQVGNPAAARHTLLGGSADLELAEVEACAHPMWLAALAEIDSALGDAGSAARWLARAHEAADALGLPGQRAYVAVSGARLATAAGDTGRALELATAAVAGFELVSQPLDAAAARLSAAGALARLGRWPDAIYQLAEARTAAERGGATWFLQQVTGMQRQIASAAGRFQPAAEQPATPVGPGPVTGPPPELVRPPELTAREWEIARLVGEGLSNGQIAIRLHVTPKTVEAHLTRVYRKLGVRSRSGLARAVTGP